MISRIDVIHQCFFVKLELLTLTIKKLKTKNFTLCTLLGYFFWKPKSRNLKQLALLKSNSLVPILARILQFRTETKIYSQIMQNMRNARKQLKTPAWHRRRADHQKWAAPPMICRRRRRGRRMALLSGLHLELSRTLSTSSTD